MGPLNGNWLALQFQAIDRDLERWPEWIRNSFEERLSAAVSRTFGSNRTNENQHAEGLELKSCSKLDRDQADAA
jgi:hypothetical protein